MSDLIRGPTKLKTGDKPSDRTVAFDVLPDGKHVSTVRMFGRSLAAMPGGLLGYTHETMVFPGENDFGDLDCERYQDETEALDGHRTMVEKWSAKAKGE